MAIFPLIIAALLQAGVPAPGTYEYPGRVVTPSGRVLSYDSYTINEDGSVTYHLTGGGDYTTFPRQAPVLR